MVRDRKGMLWRLLHSSRRVKIGLYFLLFTTQIIIYTTIFHYTYPVLEGKPITWPTSLLFVLETVTTTGYGELLPFTNQITVVMTIVMMVSGIILIFMIIPLLLIPYLSTLFQTAPPQKIRHPISGHVIIIGYDELTTALVDSLFISDLSIVLVVDDRDLVNEAARRYGNRAYVLWGDYHNPSTWNNAWVRNAREVVVCEDEQTTASIILGIREETKARIVAVVDKISFERYLRYAGADYVLSPKHVTGQILARHATLTSHVDTLIEETIFDRGPDTGMSDTENKLRIINIPILPGSRAAGKTLGELDLFRKYGAETLFLSRGGHFIFSPGPEEKMDSLTMLFLITRMKCTQEMVEREFISGGKKGSLALIAGFGDVGGSVYHELSELGIECIIIDRKPHAVTEVIGNAEDESVLREAHIEDADFCIVALNDDGVNIFTALMARNINPGLRILARANEPSSVEKLYRAGADYVALLPSIGGQVIGGVLLSEIVHVILNLPNGQVVVRKSVMKNISRTTAWLERSSGVTVLGIEGKIRSAIRPDPGERLQDGDWVIAAGYPRNLKKLIRLL